MKSILTETVLFGESIVFWGVALPAAVAVFPAIALWEKIGGALVRETPSPGCTGAFTHHRLTTAGRSQFNLCEPSEGTQTISGEFSSFQLTTTPMIMLRQLRPEIERVTRELTLFNAHGLHARPATEFVSCVLLFESTVTIHAKGKRYPADRILEILLAKLDCGDTFVLEVEGPDARRAVDRIARLPMFRREQPGARKHSRSLRWEALD